MKTIIQSMATAVLLTGMAHAASFVVSPGQSLQAAIDAAAAGDNITLQTGVYNENISITKGIDIRGAGGAVVVTGTLIITNAQLPVYIGDVAFGKSGASGITLTGTGTQNVRMDRCKLLGGGNLTCTGTIAYFYKGQFDAAVSFTTSTWTFQRCTVASSLQSINSTAKCIASTVTGTFSHSGETAGEITVFQSDLREQADITLPAGKLGWICYSTLRALNLVGGSFEITGNSINARTRNGYLVQVGLGCSAVLRNNQISGDGQGMYDKIWVIRQDGSNYIINNDQLLSPNYNITYYYANNNSVNIPYPNWLTVWVKGTSIISNPKSNAGRPQNQTATISAPWYWMTGGNTLSTAKYALEVSGTYGVGAVAISVLNGAGSVRILNNTVVDVCRFVSVAASPAGVEIRGNIHRISSSDAERVAAMGGEYWFFAEMIRQGVPLASIQAGLYSIVNSVQVPANQSTTLLAPESVRTAYAGTIVSDNNFQYAIVGGQASNNINVDPQLKLGPQGQINWLADASLSREVGPIDALYNDIDGSRCDQGAYGGHSYDPTGRTTLKPVVLSGDVSPLYVKRGGAVTIKARAAVSAAP